MDQTNKKSLRGVPFMPSGHDQLSIRQVELIDAISRHRSISRAAAELNVTQSALSHAINSIEQQLGITLFTRLKNGMEPTPYADAFRARASVIRDIIADTKRDLHSYVRPRRPMLKIQAGTRTTPIWVTPAMATLSMRFQDYIFDARTTLDNLAQNLELHETDLAVAPLALFHDTSMFFVEPVGTIDNRFFAHVTHPLADRGEVTIDDLRQFPLVGDDVPHELVDFVEGHPGRLGQLDLLTGQIIPTIRVNAIYEIFGVLERSPAIARLPHDLIHGVRTARRIIEIKTRNVTSPPVEMFAIGLKSKRHLPEISAMIDVMRDIESQRHSPKDRTLF